MSLNVPLIGFGGAADIGFEESKDYPGCFFRTVNGATEWLNPPNNVGTEYRTVARYKNKPVYEKIINIGQLPNNTQKTVATGLYGVTELIENRMVGTTADKNFSGEMHGDGVNMGHYLGSNFSNIVVFSKQDGSAYNGTAFLKYIK